MQKIDLKKTLKPLFTAAKGRFASIDVPKLPYVMIDGAGDPNTAPAYQTAVSWLYSTSYAMKFASKATLERDYVVPPLEGLWWAEDPNDFVTRNKDRWQWTMMIMVPDFVPHAFFEAAVTKSTAKLGDPPASLRFATLAEGHCLQALHIGSYDAEGPILAHLHDELMPGEGLTFNGPHHEIYLGDPRRTAPEKLKTLLRQPVKLVT